jgi:hypothetical protein
MHAADGQTRIVRLWLKKTHQSGIYEKKLPPLNALRNFDAAAKEEEVL